MVDFAFEAAAKVWYLVNMERFSPTHLASLHRGEYGGTSFTSDPLSCLAEKGKPRYLFPFSGITL